MLRLTTVATVFSGSARDLDHLREQLDRQHCIRLSGLLHPAVLAFVQAPIERAGFSKVVHEEIAVELHMRHRAANSLLHFLDNG